MCGIIFYKELIMIKINEKEYKLILLDTNVIRTIINGYDRLHKDNSFAKKILSYYFNESMLCISFYSLLELVPYKDIYDTFIEIFTSLPVFIILDFQTITNEEKTAYQENREFLIDNVAHFCLPKSNELLKYAQTVDLKKMKIDLQTTCDDWNKQRESLPKNPSPNQLFLNKTKLISKKLYAHLIMEYSVISRMCHKKAFELNDVVGIKISAITPYVDVVITENSQANIYKQTSRMIIKLREVEILTFKDINNKINN